MDDDQVRRFREQLRSLQRRLRAETPVVAGVSRSARQVLGVIARLGDGVQPGQVGDELQMTSSNVAAALRELEDARFVRRDRDGADTRRVRLSATAAGAAFIAAFRSERDSWFGQAVHAVLNDDEQRALMVAGDLLLRLADFDPSAVAGMAMDAVGPAPRVTPRGGSGRSRIRRAGADRG